MARNVFGNNMNVGDPGTQKGEDAAPRRKRFPLTVRGATSQKYIGPATEGHAFRTYQEIPLDQIAESQVRARRDLDEGIEGLVESIRKYGQHIPVTVRIVNDQRPYEIVVGSRRLAARGNGTDAKNRTIMISRPAPAPLGSRQARIAAGFHALVGVKHHISQPLIGWMNVSTHPCWGERV